MVLFVERGEKEGRGENCPHCAHMNLVLPHTSRLHILSIIPLKTLVDMYVRMYVCIYVYFYIHIHMNIHTYIYIYTHTYIHTYIHIYIYIHVYIYIYRCVQIYVIFVNAGLFGAASLGKVCADLFLCFGTRLFWPLVPAKLCAEFCTDIFE